MICPSCSNDIANNSVMCPICGEPVVRKFDLDKNEFSVGGFSDTSSTYLDLKPAKKPVNITKIIVLLFIIIAGIGVGFFLYQNKQNKELHRYDGTYRFSYGTMDGHTFYLQDFLDDGLKMDKICVIIKGDKAEFQGWEEVGIRMMKGAITFEKDEDHVKFKSSYGSRIEGTLIGDELSLDNGEIVLVFKKEE